jgi:hypothetical protein
MSQLVGQQRPSLGGLRTGGPGREEHLAAIGQRLGAGQVHQARCPVPDVQSRVAQRAADQPLEILASGLGKDMDITGVTGERPRAARRQHGSSPGGVVRLPFGVQPSGQRVVPEDPLPP